MSSLHEPLPLNHPPPPQTLSQPPLKKLRVNAKPKLTPHEITQTAVIQSALRIGREARQNVPQPGHGQHKALDTLLRNMQSWANQIAPQYTLAEFVLAAHAISGSREVRPVLAEFRLAELRDVNSENEPDRGGADADDNVQQGNTPVHASVGPVAADVGPVAADVGPVAADVGPVEADVGPEDDDWDELDLIPDEAVEIRPIRSDQTTAPAAKTVQNDNKHTLSPDIDAKIEINRRAAVERRKAIIARLQADKEAEEKKTPERVDASQEKSTKNPVGIQKQEKSNPKSQTPTLSDVSPSTSAKRNQLSQKLNISDDEPLSKSVKTLLKKVDCNTEGEQGNDATSKADVGKKAQKNAPNKPAPSEKGSQEHDESKEMQEEGDGNNRDLPSAETTVTPKASESASPKEGNVDQDVDMDILAEFEDGDDA